MALTQADKAFIAEAAAQAAAAALTAFVAAQPAQAAAPEATVATPSTEIKRSKSGRDFACTVGDGVKCTVKCRSPKRAAIHGIEQGGHAPR